MEKKTMGAFIAVLRKANGMTQQELADKLNISNKAVSRWERDECAPDITLIPALAEILGVTCDELLKGERILTDYKQEQSEPKVDKQVKALVNRSLSNFKTLIWISLAISLVGIVCMFGISYGAFRPDIGFIVMCLLAVAAFVTAAIGTNKLKEVKRDNELFINADEAVINRFNKTLGNFSFYAFALAIGVVIISIPLIVFRSNIINSVLSFHSYLMYFIVLAPAYGFLCLILKSYYYSFITEQPRKKIVRVWNKKLIAMNAVQLGTVAALCILFIVGSYYIESVGSLSITGFGIFILFAVSAVIFAVFVAVCKTDRKVLIPSGIRNILTVIPALMTIGAHNIEFYVDDKWNLNLLIFALGITLTIFLIFQLIKSFISKNNK